MLRHARTAARLVALTAVAACTVALPSLAAAQDELLCTIAEPALTEISGLAYSGLHDNIVWTHNDSGGGPYLYAIDTSSCDVAARVKIRDIEARDIEALAAGVDERGVRVLWIADVGDNTGDRKKVYLHRIAEPTELTDQAVSPTTFEVKYDTPQDAEAILAGSDAVWIISKGLLDGTVWQWGLPLRGDRAEPGREVGREEGLVTDAAMGPDGEHYVVRDYTEARIYAGEPPGARISRLPLPDQVQGEAVTWSPDGTSLIIASEGDGRLLRVPLPIEAQAPPKPVDGEVVAEDPPPDPASTPEPLTPSDQAGEAAEPGDPEPGESSAEDSPAPAAADAGTALATADQLGSLSLLALGLAAGAFVVATITVVAIVFVRDRRRGGSGGQRV